MKKVEVNKEDLSYNVNLIKNRIAGKSEIIAVVKANGMGLDLVKYTKFLIEEGIKFFAVSNTIDAITLRKNGIKQDILMLSEVINEDELTDLIKNDIILTIGNLEEKYKIEFLAKSLNKKVITHIKIDTGFARYGFIYDDEKIFEAVKSNDNIEVKGCFTHFSKAIDEKWTRVQFSRFQELIPKIKEINSNIKFHSCASTRIFTL